MGGATRRCELTMELKNHGSRSAHPVVHSPIPNPRMVTMHRQLKTQRDAQETRGWWVGETIP